MTVRRGLWIRIKCPLVGANKRFLINTIKNTIPSQRQHRESSKEDKEVSEVEQSQKKELPKKHRSHPYDRSRSGSRRDRSHSPSRSKSTKDKHDRRHRKR
ncbi:protein POLR1D isoform X2 [Lissotriton helveticus]